MKSTLLFLHRWTGIILAVYIFTIGLTGAILVFQEDAARTFREPHVPDNTAALMHVDQIVANIQAAYPGWHLHRLYWPRDLQSPWAAEVLKGDIGYLGETAFAVYLHPSQGHILATHNYGRSIWRVLQVVHINLLSGRSGRTANAVLALATLFAVLTGILMWWPGKGGRTLWKVNWSAGAKRLNWELHQVTGLYLLIFFVMFCVTGSYFAWSTNYRRAIAAVFPMKLMNRPMPSIEPIEEKDLKPISSFLPAIQAEVPNYPVTQVIFREAPNGLIRFVVNEGDRSRFYRANNLFFNPGSGELMRADLVRDRLAGDSIVNWVSAVHIGPFGLWSKLLWALAGLAFPFSTVTGLIIYVSKRQRAKPAYTEVPVGVGRQ
jgi:uncharacterized iron-regulated membrane protein